MSIPDLSGVDLTHAKDIECEECGSRGFKQTLMLKRLSALVSPNGQETIIPMQVFACEKCGYVNKEFSDVSGIQ